MLERELPRSEWVPLLARRIITQHHVDGGCGRCRSDGCDALRWARDRVRAARTGNSRPDRF
ncbi:hypothetical protein F8271_13320 [Micromonospora sp. ALFpr18c]|uniref:hypothetical protein n=1 Tax=unclassified Micromonospora TaxID=2617518 RepID=UPI00124AED5C|nr:MULTISPECIES: hypothetical protein [unclassified Micromonospora]KAB1942212.1 hypothetical protein F8271_13320 [Micromonospora sp. ALFpr18c]MDG4762186.1 hypothetical protein [Micromonospora sp. WMMD710]